MTTGHGWTGDAACTLSAFPSNTPSMSPPNVETNSPILPLGSSLLVRANEGHALHAFGEVFVVLLDGKQTGEKFTAFLSISPPGGGPGPHYHEREDEWFYIVEGRVSFLINGIWTDLFPGDCVYSPRGSVHAFKNNTDQPIRVFVHTTPAGIEGFFAEAAEEWAQPECDMGRMMAIAEKYGHHHLA
jgi:mannose-6-phosphate isomerase-like protein (cupin superfamily)